MNLPDVKTGIGLQSLAIQVSNWGQLLYSDPRLTPPGGAAILEYRYISRVLSRKMSLSEITHCRVKNRSFNRAVIGITMVIIKERP